MFYFCLPSNIENLSSLALCCVYATPLNFPNHNTYLLGRDLILHPLKLNFFRLSDKLPISSGSLLIFSLPDTSNSSRLFNSIILKKGDNFFSKLVFKGNIGISIGLLLSVEFRAKFSPRNWTACVNFTIVQVHWIE